MHNKGRTTRDVILGLAVDAIDAGGEAAVRVKQIADDAGVAVTSLYHFFGSREGLVQAALVARFEAGYARGREELEDAARSASTPEEFSVEIERILRTTFAKKFTSSRQRRLTVAGAAMSRPELRAEINDVQRTWYAELLGSLRTAQERGLIRPIVPLETITTWHLITANGLVSVEGDDTGTDVKGWLDVYIDTMLRLLGLR